jgi:hypothetical protein
MTLFDQPSSSILDGLNPPQKEAVIHDGGPLLVQKSKNLVRIKKKEKADCGLLPIILA